jgi:hypothetical protein
MARQGQQKDFGGEVEDVVKSAMGPYFVLLLLLLFSCVPLAQSIILKKGWLMP